MLTIYVFFVNKKIFFDFLLFFFRFQLLLLDIDGGNEKKNNFALIFLYKMFYINHFLVMKLLLFFFALTLYINSVAQSGIVFSFSSDGNSVILNEIKYKSAKNVDYAICQCQFFISNVKIKMKNGKKIEFDNFVHYVDIEIANTQKAVFPTEIDLHQADSIEFTFGIDSALNISRRFKNPPENLMFWPDYLGGGYHYMKTNIKYIDKQGFTSAFNCHIGRGQVYDENDNPINYIENTFVVKLPIKIANTSTGTFATINLNISKIFNFPNAVDFNDYRGIMDNQQAMSIFCENLKTAFSN